MYDEHCSAVEIRKNHYGDEIITGMLLNEEPLLR
jgi:hypothetical protein